MRKLAPARDHPGMTSLFPYRVYRMTGPFHMAVKKVDFILIKYTCDLKSQILRIRYLSQSSGRPISHRNEWSFHVPAFI